MASYLTQHRRDLLISFAGQHATAGDGLVEWARDLSTGLRSLLSQKLGRRDGVEVQASAAGDGASSDSALLLVLLSSAYAEQAECRAEVDAFLDSIGDDDLHRRVFVILADDLDRPRWPPALQSCLPWAFLRGPDGGRAGQFGAAKLLDPSDKQFPIRLDDLSTDIARSLERLHAVSEGNPAGDSPTVFLGGASDDLITQRDSLRRYLVQEGFETLPRQWRPDVLDTFREITERDLRRANFFVQLLGKNPPTGFGGLEAEIAAGIGLPILCWRDPEIDTGSVDDAEQRLRLEGENVLAVRIEEFKRKVVESAYASADEPGESSGKPMVVVAASDVDQPLAQRIGGMLGEQGFDIRLSETDQFPWDRHGGGAAPVGGLVIMYGECPAIWVRQQLWNYRKIMARIESRPPLCAVCEGPPEAKDPLRFRLPQMDVIDCRVNVTEAALSSFVSAVQRRFAS